MFWKTTFAAAFLVFSLLACPKVRTEENSHVESQPVSDAGNLGPKLPKIVHRYKTDPSLLTHIDPKKLASMDNTPANNPLSDAGATLGRVLFYDKQLSKNNTIACASCHHQQHGFSDPRRYSLGFNEGSTKRNAMGLANLRYSVLNDRRPGFFWDERAATLEIQALMPIQDMVEMGMDLDRLEKKLQSLPYYPPLFKKAFGSSEITRVKVAKAIAQFMRAMESFDSKFDRAARAMNSFDYTQDFDALTAEENLGKSLFIDGIDGVAEIGCAHCHIPPTFGMPRSFNNGLDLEYTDQGLGARNVPVIDPFSPSNDGRFKAPPLRNIALTAPYMHDGRFESLQQVVEHYSNGVHAHKNLDLALKERDAVEKTGQSGFQLTATQQSALVAFLKTLTDTTFISDPKFSDPFVRSPTADSSDR